jgi:hypothetical protein
MTVYKKEDIPERYHLKNHYRVAPIVCVTDMGYVVVKVSQIRASRLYVTLHSTVFC